jgi:nucleoside-diphosphate-sugar epimerase
MMNKESRIFGAGHRGLVGSALARRLTNEGFTNLLTRTRQELDLTDPVSTDRFFADERPEYVLLAAAKVGGIAANDTYPADFIRVISRSRRTLSTLAIATASASFCFSGRPASIRRRLASRQPRTSFSPALWSPRMQRTPSRKSPASRWSRPIAASTG